MYDRNPLLIEGRTPARVGVKEFLEIGLRWRGRILIVFTLTVLCGLVGAYVFQEYESVMKIQVKRERANPLEAIVGQQVLEVDLLRSDEVLQKVVRKLGLHNQTQEPLWYRLSGAHTGTSEEIRTAKAVRKLASDLQITLPKQSNLITVSYSSGHPRVAADVLKTLAYFYMEKHMAVQRSAGQLEFFNREAERYRRELADVEAQLAHFPHTEGTVAGQMELELEVRRIGELKLEQQQTQVAIEEIRKRMATLEEQLSSTPARMTTTVRTADNEHLMMQLKTTLLNLELRRTELLKKFQPTYREVQEVDKQIEQTREAIAGAEISPRRDQTTDRDPTYEWLRSEQAKARAELNALRARAGSLAKLIPLREQRARALNESSLRQEDLLRTAKGLEEGYQLYLQKREEARISDAQDQRKILNASIVQQPTVPTLPNRSPWLIVMASFVIAALLSVSMAFASEYLDDTIRTPDEVRWYLNLPVLAVLRPQEKRLLEARQR